MPERATIQIGRPIRAGRQQGDIIMGDLFQPWHLIIIAVILVVLFGGKKLPELGKGLGEGLRGFKEGMKGITDEAKDAKPADAAHTVTPIPKVGDDLKPPAA